MNLSFSIDSPLHRKYTHAVKNVVMTINCSKNEKRKDINHFPLEECSLCIGCSSYHDAQGNDQLGKRFFFAVCKIAESSKIIQPRKSTAIAEFCSHSDASFVASLLFKKVNYFTTTSSVLQRPRVSAKLIDNEQFRGKTHTRVTSLTMYWAVSQTTSSRGTAGGCAMTSRSSSSDMRRPNSRREHTPLVSFHECLLRQTDVIDLCRTADIVG